MVDGTALRTGLRQAHRRDVHPKQLGDDLSGEEVRSDEVAAVVLTPKPLCSLTFRQC